MSLSDRVGARGAGDAVSFPSAPSLQKTAGPRPDGKDLSQLKAFVHKYLLDELSHRLYEGDLDAITLQRHVLEGLTEAVKRTSRPLTSVERANLMQEIVDEILGLGPLQPLLRDDDITEVMVNSFDSIYIERGGKLQRTDLRFGNEEHLRRTIERIVSRVGRRIDESSPLVDARLPDGSRVNAAIPPIALDGCSLTIRKFSSEPFTAKDMVTFGTFSPNAMEFVRAAVMGRLNILVSGGTGSGKTTTLNVLSSFIPENERIITVEDAAELRLAQPHIVRLEARPANAEGHGLVTIRDLVRNALRMRPDRIVVGEVRDAAAFDMLQAMNTGHEGSLTTVHANSPREALLRLESLILMAGLELPVRVIREQISSAIDLVIQQSRLRNGARHIIAISEVLGADDEGFHLRDLFTFEYGLTPHGRLGTLRATGEISSLLGRLRDHGVSVDESLFQRDEAI